MGSRGLSSTNAGLLASSAVWLAIGCSASQSDSGGFAGSTSDASGGAATADSTAMHGTASDGSGGSSSGFAIHDSGSSGTGACRTGLYSGTFSCLFYSGLEAGIGPVPDSGGLGPIMGTLSFMLTQKISTTGELNQTDIASGTFAAATGGFIAADADLSGVLDCGSGKFVGQLLNGVYGLSFNPSTPPLPDPNNKFSGPLDSDYNGTTSSFVNGRWSMAIAGQGACTGTWTASYVGPGDAGSTDAGGQ